jgi:hypothetical protein
MNARGAYVQTKQHPYRAGYQWGALASPRTWTWGRIAEASMEAGRNAGAEAQASFDCRVRGLPWHPRLITREGQDALDLHRAPLPAPEDVACCLFAADTQDAEWYWLVRAVDAAENTYLVATGRAKTVPELIAAWDAPYLGRPCEAGMIDEGGHRGPDVWALVAVTAGLYSFKGDTRVAQRWKPMQEHPRRILGHARLYQAELLYLIYTQADKDRGYWFLPPDLDKTYCSHMLSVRKNAKVRHGDRYELWEPVADDHWFDAEKICRCLWDVVRAQFQAHHYRIPVPWIRPAPPRPNNYDDDRKETDCEL